MVHYPHLLIVDAAVSERYTATRGGGTRFATPPRDREKHAAQVIGALEAAQNQRERFPVRVGNAFYQSPGLTLSFESDPGFPLAFESLDLQRSKIQLLSVTTDAESRTTATVHVPDDKVQVLLRKLERYRDYDVESSRGRDNRRLVESIANIKLATLRELWTDEPELYPAANTAISWEVWLRRAMADEDSPTNLVRNGARDFGYEVISNDLSFIDRTVVLVRGTREQISRGAEVLGVIAEVRKAKVTTDFYSLQSVADQHALSQQLLQRIAPPHVESPAVGLLDTGVNHGHPLLSPVIADADVDEFKPGWGTHDGYPDGHGTQMAGLAIYGDLTEVLSGSGPIALTHGVQSLKFIHQRDPHRPDLYGVVSIEGISRLEINPRSKIYCMAVTADARDRGRPSSWSAAIDNLAYGAINNVQRLIVVAAGNTEFQDRKLYPDYNETASVQDPAQAWNALTVGGYTDKVLIDQTRSPGWTALAARGDLAPSSTTSMTWPRGVKAPFKPDVVMEAGNMGRPPTPGDDPDFLAELQMLTTNYRFSAGVAPFAEFHDTSAASALAAHLATKLLARYPNYTPETIRGFMVHSARWTEAMLTRATDGNGKLDVSRLLRTFGYGVPDPEALFYSAGNNLTLVVQDSLAPFYLSKDGGVKSNEINFHDLPWPRDALLALPLETPLELRVTLSYFIEPSPGERGWDRKYGYASHGLRFSVMRATETREAFKRRINAYERDEDYEADHAGETGSWDLGVVGPTNGSLHSNIWRGTAADLANRGCIAVYPTLGWWRTRQAEKRYDNRVRYSFLASISTPETSVDIYTPVAIQVGIDVPVEIP